jgi:hypothetical protein
VAATLAEETVATLTTMATLATMALLTAMALAQTGQKTTVATLTAMAAGTGDGAALTAREGEANHREEHRKGTNEETLH